MSKKEEISHKMDKIFKAKRQIFKKYLNFLQKKKTAVDFYTRKYRFKQKLNLLGSSPIFNEILESSTKSMTFKRNLCILNRRFAFMSEKEVICNKIDDILKGDKFSIGS